MLALRLARLEFGIIFCSEDSSRTFMYRNGSPLRSVLYSFVVCPVKNGQLHRIIVDNYRDRKERRSGIVPARKINDFEILLLLHLLLFAASSATRARIARGRFGDLLQMRNLSPILTVGSVPGRWTSLFQWRS